MSAEEVRGGVQGGRSGEKSSVENISGHQARWSGSWSEEEVRGVGQEKSQEWKS